MWIIYIAKANKCVFVCMGESERKDHKINLSMRIDDQRKKIGKIFKNKSNKNTKNFIFFLGEKFTERIMVPFIFTHTRTHNQSVIGPTRNKNLKVCHSFKRLYLSLKFFFIL